MKKLKIDKFKKYDFVNATDESIQSDIIILEQYSSDRELLKSILTEILDSVILDLNGNLPLQTEKYLNILLFHNDLFKSITDEIYDESCKY